MRSLAARRRPRRPREETGTEARTAARETRRGGHHDLPRLLRASRTRACADALRRLAATLERAIAAQPEASAADIDGGNGDAALALEQSRAAAKFARSRRTSSPRSARRRRGRTLDELWVGDECPSAGGTPPLGMSGRSATGWTRAVVARDGDDDGILARARRRSSRAKTSSSSTRTRRKRFSRAGDGSTRPLALRARRVVLGAGRVRGVDSTRRGDPRRGSRVPVEKDSRTRSSRASREHMPRRPRRTARAAGSRTARQALSAVERGARGTRLGGGRRLGDTSGAWASVRACLTGCFASFASNETLTSEALATFAAASASRVAGGPAPPHPKFWKPAPCRDERRTTRTARRRRSKAALRAAAAAAAPAHRKGDWHKARVAVGSCHGRPRGSSSVGSERRRPGRWDRIASRR